MHYTLLSIRNRQGDRMKNRRFTSIVSAERGSRCIYVQIARDRGKETDIPHKISLCTLFSLDLRPASFEKLGLRPGCQKRSLLSCPRPSTIHRMWTPALNAVIFRGVVEEGHSEGSELFLCDSHFWSPRYGQSAATKIAAC